MAKNLNEIVTTLRLTKAQAANVQAAAEVTGQSVTAFIRSAAILRATSILTPQEEV